MGVAGGQSGAVPFFAFFLCWSIFSLALLIVSLIVLRSRPITLAIRATFHSPT